MAPNPMLRSPASSEHRGFLPSGTLPQGLWSLPLQKFVSTTIRPTLMPYPELYNWDTCAQFISDFLSMVPLPDPLKPVSITWGCILRPRSQRWETRQVGRRRLGQPRATVYESVGAEPLTDPLAGREDGNRPRKRQPLA